MEVQTLVLFALLGLAAASPHVLSNRDTRIAGGVEARIEDVPFLLQLEQYQNGLWYIAGSAVIIGPDAVLTAGNLVYYGIPQWTRFRSGSGERGIGGTIHNVTDITINPNYRPMFGYSDNDIALIRVTPPFTFNSTTQSIPLIDFAPKTGDNATISGWGAQNEDSELPSPTVRRAEVSIIDNVGCEELYGSTALISEHMVCAGDTVNGGKDACSLDGGGPLVINNKLAGLVSFGVGCARPDKPGVYANVFTFVPWINQVLNETAMN